MPALIATPATIRTVLGTWSPAEPRLGRENIDLEVQVVTGFYEAGPSTISVPSSRRSRTQRIDPLDAFFGASRSTQDSRHDDRHPVVVYQEDVPPPPYAEVGDLPAYIAIGEPPTLAMYLFKFGFLFPLFWLAGIFVLLCPLTPPENWELTKSEAERAELLSVLRKTEVKWARRCLVTFSTVVLAVITLTTIFVMRSP